MKKIKIIALNFDDRIKVLMAISIIISIVIIIYSFYSICIENGVKNDDVSSIEDPFKISRYEATYTVNVVSNKNSNTYKVKENADILNGEYTFIIDDKLNINITSNQINISKENIDYKYIIEKISDYGNSNFLSFSTIIDIINKIETDNAIGNIKKVESDGKIIYKIHTNEEIISKIKDIDIEMSKNEEKIMEIKMYNLDGIEQYFIAFESFIVKK